MKLKLLIASVILACTALAQTGPSLPTSLPQLASILPSLIHGKTFQPGPFSDAVDAALRKDPSSAIEAVVICGKNLGDSDQQVRLWTLAVLHAIATTAEGPTALKAADDQIAQILVKGDDTSKRLALLIAIDLRQNVPDSFIPPLELLLAAKGASEGIRAGAAGVLVMAKPSDPDVQQMIVNLINDTSQTRNLRSQMIHSCGFPSVGPIITDNVVRIANTTADKDFRDAAIYAATQIDSAAVARIRTRIEAILKDPTESDTSRLTASAASQMLH